MPHVFVPKERAPGERRVAATPETVKKLVGLKCEVVVEAGAGEGAGRSDADYVAAGAAIATDIGGQWRTADIVLKVTPLADSVALGGHEADAPKEGAIVACLCRPHRHLDVVRRLRDRKVSALALELIPRITRSQSMDVLSSQASIAGYKAALLAANRVPRYFPMLMTAAGTVKPARVVVIGAGVAGLQAIATCRRLGAVVEVSDVRAAAKEEAESLGARFIQVPQDERGEGQGGYAKEMKEEFLRRQREVLAERIAASNAVITTALVPGRPAPKLVSQEMVEGMRPGSVVVDLAGEEGGNCALSRPDEEVVHRGVAVLAPTHLPSEAAEDASMLLARNVLNLLQLVIDKDGRTVLNLEDEIVAGTLLTHAGEVRHDRTREALQAQEGAA